MARIKKNISWGQYVVKWESAIQKLKIQTFSETFGYSGNPWLGKLHNDCGFVLKYIGF